MRWLILSDDHLPLVSGVATWTAAITEALRQAGDTVQVHARARPGLPDGVRPVRGPSFARWGSWYMRLATRRFRPTADRVLATTWPVAARLPDPFDVVCHGSDITRPARDPALRDRTLGRASRRLAVSRFLADQVGDCIVLPAPIDPLPPRARPRLERWAFVGRAVPTKGGDRFVRAVARAGARGVLIGDGPALPAWRDLASESGADIRFTGSLPRAEALALLDACDLHVLLPRLHPDGTGGEGLGLVTLEAAARSVPSVVCATGGAAEARGLVVDDPDDPDAVCDAIRAWWHPDRGAEARHWLAGTHGSARAASTLRTFFDPVATPRPPTASKKRDPHTG